MMMREEEEMERWWWGRDGLKRMNDEDDEDDRDESWNWFRDLCKILSIMNDSALGYTINPSTSMLDYQIYLNWENT